MKRISSHLVLALAVIAAVVATGLMLGLPMWAWIVGYWVVLTAKNTVDYIGIKCKEENHENYNHDA